MLRHDHSGGLDPTGKITPALIHSIGQNALDIAINAATTEGPEDPLFWVESAGPIASLINDASTIAIGHPIIPLFIVNDLTTAGTIVGVTDAGSSVYDAATGILNGTASISDLGNEVMKAIPTLISALPNIPSEVKSLVNGSIGAVAPKVVSLLSGLKF